MLLNLSNSVRFLAVWEALTQYIENASEEPTAEEQALVTAAESLQAIMDAHRVARPGTYQRERQEPAPKAPSEEGRRDADRAKRYGRFMQAAKGLTAWDTARVINDHSNGVDFRGCAKGHMAETYAETPWIEGGISKIFEGAIGALEKAAAEKRGTR